jgi:DNA invertase Pin-like site-specific DNA recombinase
MDTAWMINQKMIKIFCKSKCWNLVEIYTDAGLSTTKDSHRPSLEKVMEDTEAGFFVIVVVE